MLETLSLLLVVEIRPAGVAGATHHPRRSGDLKLGASGWVSGPASGVGGVVGWALIYRTFPLVHAFGHVRSYVRREHGNLVRHPLS